MSATAKLAGFAAGLLLVFGGATVAGGAIGPDRDGSDAAGDDAMAGHGGDEAAPDRVRGLAVSAGVTIYVAASNLVPEFQAKRGWLTALAFFGGTVGFIVSERLLAQWTP